MKATRITYRLLAALLSLGAFALPTSPRTATAASTSTVHFKFNGQVAFAEFDSVNGCVETFTYVAASQHANSSEADLFIGQFDTCSQTVLQFAFGSTSSPALQIASDFSSATLNTTIPVQDPGSGNTFDVSVSLAWTATGPLVQENDKFHYHTAGVIENAFYNARERDAQASGTISDGTTTYSPSASVFAQIGRFNESGVYISHA
jgi:hypothetical protein